MRPMRSQDEHLTLASLAPRTAILLPANHNMQAERLSSLKTALKSRRTNAALILSRAGISAIGMKILGEIKGHAFPSD